METNKILTANILDLLFDNRNKDYGAYELRKTYQQRIIKSIVITTSIAGIIFILLAFAKKNRVQTGELYTRKEITIEVVKEPEKIPEPKTQPDPPQTRTEIYTPPVIVDKEVVNPPPTMEELDSARIDVFKRDGVVDNGTTGPTVIKDGLGIIDDKPKDKDDGPFTTVQVEAKYAGNWENFLRRNLRADVPVDNGAPSGRYTIVIQFIVDVDGTVSNIVPLTHIGYGMEEEAVRVLKKADKWEPAFQNGIHVKAYRRQPITFEVLTED